MKRRLQRLHNKLIDRKIKKALGSDSPFIQHNEDGTIELNEKGKQVHSLLQVNPHATKFAWDEEKEKMYVVKEEK